MDELRVRSAEMVDVRGRFLSDADNGTKDCQSLCKGEGTALLSGVEHTARSGLGDNALAVAEKNIGCSNGLRSEIQMNWPVTHHPLWCQLLVGSVASREMLASGARSTDSSWTLKSRGKGSGQAR